MDWNEATILAALLMDMHGLQNVDFCASRSARIFGCTTHNRKYNRVTGETTPWVATKIELSRPLTELNSVEMVRDTILHEIAHVKAGPEAEHGWQWKQVAKQLGANPERCCGAGVVEIPGKYQGTCGCPGRVFNFYRMQKRDKWCRTCHVQLSIHKVEGE